MVNVDSQIWEALENKIYFELFDCIDETIDGYWEDMYLLDVEAKIHLQVFDPVDLNRIELHKHAQQK